MKKILDHIIWILIVVTAAATAIVSIVSDSLGNAGDFFDVPWWLGAVLLLFKVAPWLCLALELLITIRDSTGGRHRKPSAVVFNAVAAILAVIGCAAAAIGADSFIVFVLPVLWSVVRIIDAIVFRKERERAKLLKSPVFLVVTAVLIVIVAVAALTLSDRGVEDPLDYTGEFSSETILEAWEGEFDEEKLKAAIAEYEKSCTAYVLTEAEADVPFFLTVNYEPQSAKVVRLAPADQKDPGFELKTYIDMTISTTCIANNVAVPVAWWYSDSDTWVGDYPLWSYLLRVTDADGVEHYYYFRVSYNLSSDDTTADDATSNGTTSDPGTDDVIDPFVNERTILVGTVLNAEGGALALSVGGTDPNDPYGGVNYYVKTTLADGTKVTAIEAGDTVAVTYDGMVAESYPMQIFTVYAIDVVNGAMLESGHKSGRSVGGVTYDDKNEVAYLEGYVTYVGENTIGVYTGGSIAYYGATYDYSVRMLLPDGTKSEADLKKWDRVKITFDGEVVETVPEQIDSIYSIEVIASVEEKSSEDDESTDTPYMLYFDSFDELAELRDMICAEDEKLKDYLRSKNFDMNGLSSKEDVINLFDKIGEAMILHINEKSGYKLRSIFYCEDYGYVQLMYRDGDNLIRTFCYLDQGNGVADSVTAGYFDSAPVGTLAITGETVNLYKIEAELSAYKFRACAYTENSQVQIQFSNDDEKHAEEIGEYTGLSTLNELIG